MTTQQRKARQTLLISRLTMVLAAVAMIVTILMAYPLADRFSLGMQITAHLLLPVAAGLFKLGYVVRLAAHHTLGNYAAG